MFRKTWLNYFTTLANTSEQKFTFVNLADDYQQRVLKAIYVGIATAGVTINLYSAGQQRLSIDCTRFASGNLPVEIEIPIDAKIQPTIGIVNLAGAILTNVPVVLFYETPKL